MNNSEQKQRVSPASLEADYPSSTSSAAPESSSQTSAVPVRRHQVDTLLRQGYSNREIAEQLGVSEAIVKKDVQAICARAGVDNTREYFAKLLRKFH